MNNYYGLLFGGITVFICNLSDVVYAETNYANEHQTMSTVQQQKINNQNQHQLKSKLSNLSNQQIQQSHPISANKLILNSYSSKHLQPINNNIPTEYITQFPDFEDQKVIATFPSLSDKNINSNTTNLIIADADHQNIPGKWSAGRPDGHAPIGVMGDHSHKKGEFMFSYRYMLMEMNGNRSGTNSISNAEVLQDFMVTPDKMTMQMHMFGGMYAVDDNLTLMAMVPYVVKEMDHITRSGASFTTTSEGFGDISTTALYKILDQNQQRIHLNLGVSFPTGSINERDNTPAGTNQILPYPMQIGSGTFDLLPGITYLGQSGENSWGSQLLATVRLGENDNSYKLGDQLQLSAWVARNLNNWLASSIRLKGRTWGNINGADSRLNPAMIPTADPNLRGGTQLDLGIGLNLYAPEGDLKGSRLALEFELPLYRDLNGPQLENDWLLTIGLQTSF